MFEVFANDLPAQVFLQGNPACACGVKGWMVANHDARLMMEKLEHWDKKSLLDYKGKVIKTWSKNEGAIFENEGECDGNQ
jgi:hypothetical protein